MILNGQEDESDVENTQGQQSWGDEDSPLSLEAQMNAEAMEEYELLGTQGVQEVPPLIWWLNLILDLFRSI